MSLLPTFQEDLDHPSSDTGLLKLVWPDIDALYDQEEWAEKRSAFFIKMLPLPPIYQKNMDYPSFDTHPLRGLVVNNWPNIEVCISDRAEFQYNDICLHGDIFVEDIPFSGYTKETVNLFFERVELELTLWGDDDKLPLHSDFNGSIPGRVYMASSTMKIKLHEFADQICETPQLRYNFTVKVPRTALLYSESKFHIIQLNARAWYQPSPLFPFSNTLCDPPTSIAGPWSSIKHAHVSQFSFCTLSQPGFDIQERKWMDIYSFKNSYGFR